jgi:hypothetical protein
MKKHSSGSQRALKIGTAARQPKGANDPGRRGEGNK